LNASDEDAAKWIRIFTFLSQPAIEELTLLHGKNPAERTMQKRLAREVTIFIHGQAAYEAAIKTTEKLFGGDQPAEALSESDLHAMEGIVKSRFPKSRLAAGLDVVSFLAEAGILASKGEARKMVQQAGISINRRKVEDIQFRVDEGLFLHGKYLLVQKGKRNYYLVEAE
jgi:tyrosyl-tRNA synthetase